MHKKTVFFLAVFLLFFALFLAGAQAGGGISLSFHDTLRIVDEKNAEILMAKDHIEQALARVTQAQSYFFPEISGTVSENRQTANLESFGIPKTSSSAPSVVGPFNVFDARVHVTQTLFDLSMIRRFQAALATGDVSKAELRKIKEDVLALAGTEFVQARRAQSRVEFAKEYLRLAVSRERILRQRLGLGVASVTEAQNAKAELSQARYLWRSSTADASASLLDLKLTLGFSAGQELSLQEEGINTISLPASSQIAQSAQKHPDVIASSARQKQEQAQEAAEKASFLPSIEGTANYGANGKDVDSAKQTYVFGAQALWNFFDFGRRDARVHEASSRAGKAKTNFSQTLREKESKIYEAKDSFKNAEKFLTAKKDQWSYEQNSYETVKNKFQNGSASRLDLIAASASLARSSDELEEAKSLYRISQINLYHALGQMQKFLEDKKS